VANEIVVGVDGSANALAALRWAIEQAEHSGAVVRAVHAWHVPYVGDISGVTVLPDPRYLAEGAAAILDHAIESAGVPEGVTIIRDVAEGSAAAALIGRAAGARLLVVGTHGHGGIAGRLLGSVASQCVNHAPAPVVVVPSSWTPKRRR
jgi:nucleotide-binding universal stress UspA family protein